ncbi:unnamed protein product [Symbiodinium microadriaticum]|nr:unnamed protein product [Symbiodinium sp. KB8]CAE7869349.1 unnamed protein product [Symbiodinium microadriaticum]
MSTSDRLYLEDACPTLQRLLQSLVEEPGTKLDDSDFLDFEVAFSTAMEGETLKLKVTYEFLANVLEHGSKELLEQVWADLPLRFAPVSTSELEVVLNTAALAENQDLARRCVQQVATTRIWLLVGPLVAPLRWLREAVATGDKAAAAAPQNAQQARKDAMGQPPAPIVLHVRQQETCCIVPKEDRILVILSIHLEDDVDVALGRAFCQEFAETNRKGNEFSLPGPRLSVHCPGEMKRIAVLSVAYLLGAAASDAAPKQYPVTKVVNLLKDMQKKLEEEAEKDEEVDEKMKCWCKETQQSKAESITKMQSEMANLGGQIDTSAADSLRLVSELKGHEEDLASSQTSLGAAEAQRKKQLASYEDEVKEMEESLTGVSGALHTLKNKASFLSTSASAAKQDALELVKKLQRKHSNILMGVVTPRQRKLMLAMTSKRLDVDAAVEGSPATGEVVGVLSSMKDTFEQNLNRTRAEEAESTETFQALRKAKETEMHATEEAIVSKKSQKAEADKKKAWAAETLQDAKASLLSDQQFLQDAKEKCAAHEAEYAERVAARNEEITGCSKAIAMLSDDSARDTFSRTFNAGAMFLQVDTSKEHRVAASETLTEAAAKLHDSRLAALARMVRTDSLDAVKKEIDKLTSQLKEVQKEEVKGKDSCVQRLHENTLDTEQSTLAKTQSGSKLTGLQDLVATSEASAKTLSTEIEDLKSELKTAKTDMELRQNESHAMIEDQVRTQRLLTRAADVLHGVYGASLLQEKPEGFKDYQRQSGSVGIISMLHQIIGDAKIMETKARADLNASLADYERFKADATSAIAKKEQSLVDLAVQKSEAKSDALEMKKEVKRLSQELDDLSATKSALKEECEFLVTNFELRQDARSQEIEALHTAKAVLSGMKTDGEIA